MTIEQQSQFLANFVNMVRRKIQDTAQDAISMAFVSNALQAQMYQIKKMFQQIGPSKAFGDNCFTYLPVLQDNVAEINDNLEDIVAICALSSDVNQEVFFNKMHAIMCAKGDDYAKDDDRLSNFKMTAKMCMTGPDISCLVLIATKVARISNLIATDGSVRAEQNESIQDSFLDLALYAVLYSMILNEAV